MFPALATASRDRALLGCPSTVYMFLTCNLLDFCEYRPLKLAGLAYAMRIDYKTAWRSVGVLVDRGYLDRQREGRAFTYRLRYTVRDADTAREPALN